MNPRRVVYFLLSLLPFYLYYIQKIRKSNDDIQSQEAKPFACLYLRRKKLFFGVEVDTWFSRTTTFLCVALADFTDFCVCLMFVVSPYYVTSYVARGGARSS